MRLYADLYDKITVLCQEGLEQATNRHELDHLKVGVLLLHVANDLTRQGGVSPYYSTLVGMRGRSEREMEKLVAEFGEDVHDPFKRANMKLHDNVQ